MADIYKPIIIVIVISEVLFLTRKKKGMLFEITVVLIISIGVTIIYEPSEWVRQNKYLESLVANFLGVLLPLLIMVAANELIIKNIKNNIAKHLLVFGGAFIALFIGFWWNLYLVCTLGVDCL